MQKQFKETDSLSINSVGLHKLLHRDEKKSLSLGLWFIVLDLVLKNKYNEMKKLIPWQSNDFFEYHSVFKTKTGVINESL